MLLFRPEHVPLILDGTKTQTRRLWPHGCRVKVGGVHQARIRMLDASSTFTRLRILRVWQEPIGIISCDDAHAEGYSDQVSYREAFSRINHLWNTPAETPVWCVEFEVVKELPTP